MKNQEYGCMLLMAVVVMIVGTSRANAAATDDIQITVSNETCDGFDPGASFIVYAKNKNTARPISATFQYDSNPSSQSFSAYDANLSPITDRFPKPLVIRIPAGATVPIGCTFNYRPSTPPNSIAMVPIVITLSGAAYVNPSQPNPPPEDALAFSAFLLQTGFSGGCAPGAKPTGVFYLLNLHPYAHLTATIGMVNADGTPPGQVGKDLPPLGATRVGCSNGNASPAGVKTAKLVYPPGQKKQP